MVTTQIQTRPGREDEPEVTALSPAALAPPEAEEQCEPVAEPPSE